MRKSVVLASAKQPPPVPPRRPTNGSPPFAKKLESTYSAPPSPNPSPAEAMPRSSAAASTSTPSAPRPVQRKAPAAIPKPRPSPRSPIDDDSSGLRVGPARPGGFQVVLPPREDEVLASGRAARPPPEYPYVVVVEGFNDYRVVRRVATCPVVIMGGNEMAQQHIDLDRVDIIKKTMRFWRCRSVVVLTDPDYAGRQLRDALDRSLPKQCLHAFVSGLDALTTTGDERHNRGDLGIEYASPSFVLDALANPRASDPERKAISKEDLASRGLTQEFGAAPDQGKSSKLYRFLVGLILGLGESTGKQFLAQLNRYEFTLGEVDEALAVARELVESAENGGGGDLDGGEVTEWWRRYLTQ